MKKAGFSIILVLLMLATFAYYPAPAAAWGVSTKISITATPTTVPAGQKVTLTITELNNGDCSSSERDLSNAYVVLDPGGAILNNLSANFSSNQDFRTACYNAGHTNDNPPLSAVQMADSTLQGGEAWQWTVTVPVSATTTFVVKGYGTSHDGNLVNPNDFPSEQASVTVTVVPPNTDVSVIKTADQDTVTAGQPIGFAVTVSNTGAADASNVKLNDPLPAGAGGDILWTIDPSAPGTNPGSFQITGPKGSQVLTLNPSTGIVLPAGKSLKVHITSPTSAADATGGASGGGFDSSGTAASGIITLGSANNYGVLGLVNTSIKNSNVTIQGNAGVSQGGSLTNMAPSTITGNFYEYAAGQYSGPGILKGSKIVNPTLLNKNDADALSASTTAAALPATQTFGPINTDTTVIGTGGLNVIKINGNITRSLTLSGTPTSVFVVNVAGTVTVGGSSVLGLAGGVTANHVLYNFTGSSGTITSKVGNKFYGTLLAPKYSFDLDGVFNGEIIGGGKTIVLMSGAKVNSGGASKINNTAVVSADNDSNPGNNTSSATITLQ